MKQAIFILSLIIICGFRINACSISPYNNSTDFRQSKAVFIGKVIDVTVDDTKRSGMQRWNTLYKIRFNVEKSWKGKASEITVISDNGQEPCGRFKFQIGEKYLVYAYPFEQKLAVWATVASPTSPLNLEDSVIKMRLKDLNSFWFRWKADFWHL